MTVEGPGSEPGGATDAAALRLQGMMAYASADYTTARGCIEAVFRAHRDAGEPAVAAMAAMDLAEMHQSVFGNRSASRGWLARAQRLIEPLGDVVEVGYLELAITACDRPDVAELAAAADRALAIARRFHDHDLEIRALADGGLARVSQGRLREGFSMLDEALAAITAGDARRLDTAPKSMCSLLSSCDRAADLTRADEWVRLIEGAPPEGVPVVLAEHCRMVRSGLLVAAGRWDEAQTSLETLLAGMNPGSPHRVESMARLAELLIHRGRLEDAAALVEPHQDAVAMRAPLARLHLARGELGTAVAVAELGVRELVADRLRGAPLLDIAVRAELARGDVDAAAGFAEQLATLAEGADAPALRADAAAARGRVAVGHGDHDLAIAMLGEAWRGFDASSRPLHAGIARLDLATALAAAGDRGTAAVEAAAAMTCFERIGATSLADRAAQLLRSMGVRVRTRADTAEVLAALTPRESEVLDLLTAGLTNAEIGARLFISGKTVEHHVGHVLGKLGARTRAEAASIAVRLGVAAGRTGPAGGSN